MIEEARNICKIETNADLTKYNTYRLNSFCYALAFIFNENELISLIKYLNDNNIKWFILGGGSNIILPKYYDGVAIKLNLCDYEIKDDILYAQSGCMINKLAISLANMGYSGIDFAAGVPGTIGGCVYGNAGCYGKSISDALISAKIFDGNKIIELTNEELKFDYRYSILKKKKKYVVLSAKFKIEKCNKEEVLSQIEERAQKRMTTQDLVHPTCGSVFRNPEGLAAGKLIDDLGLKGYHINDAMISNIHANFIINNGNANSEDIIKLVKYIKKEVKKEYNISLIMEQEIIK